jgi:hypothetical protein
MDLNNFSGTGTFDFLGPVQLLVFEGKPASPDVAIKLADQAYS